MKKNFLLMFGIVCMTALVYGQNTSVTNNNTIVIQGNVYYFKPATTPSSPQPKVGASNFIGTGSWYGADAAKAWASIADWAIEHCLSSDGPVKPSNGEIVYISSVHAFRADTPEAKKYGKNSYFGGYALDHYDGIVIYYWVVSRGAQMEDGRRATRGFLF
jgi:hypothetical protein